MTIRPVTLTDDVKAMILSYEHVGDYIPSPHATRWGAFGEKGKLVAVIGWIEAPNYRYVVEWTNDGTRPGAIGQSRLATLARKDSRVVGMIALANEAAFTYIERNRGREIARLIELPALAS